ncbi:MAG: FMN-binding protein [Acidobacteriota bacterium]|nr:FMN-binding protein [Acidobacteriota bacterium]
MKRQITQSQLVLSVTITALVAGFCLSGVYTLTAPRIAANQAEATRKAIFRVLPDTTDYETVEEGIYRGLNASGESTGLALAASGSGYGGPMEILFGYNPETRRVVGLEILSSLETPGLGDKIETDPAFTASFKDLLVDPIIECKAERRADNQVDSISGATISSKAVVRIINERLAELNDTGNVNE